MSYATVSPMKTLRRSLKWLAAFALLYGVLWGATALGGAWWLERQLRAELVVEWQRVRAEAMKEKELYPGHREYVMQTMAFASGPVVRIKAFSCPAPFVVDAQCGRVIGGLNGYGTIGRYVLTPWRVYVIYESGTWIS